MLLVEVSREISCHENENRIVLLLLCAMRQFIKALKTVKQLKVLFTQNDVEELWQEGFII